MKKKITRRVYSFFNIYFYIIINHVFMFSFTYGSRGSQNKQVFFSSLIVSSYSLVSSIFWLLDWISGLGFGRPDFDGKFITIETTTKIQVRSNFH